LLQRTQQAAVDGAHEAAPRAATRGPRASPIGNQAQLRRLQTKLRVNEPGDVCEQEADRVADEVLAKPAHSDGSGAPPRIQRFSGGSDGQTGVAPASVERALANPGKPLESALRQDMEQRFGHDFSHARVHSDAAAEQSARDVNAHAYTVGHDIVFGVGRFAPATHEGRRLIAHELTHVVQQSYGEAPSGPEKRPLNFPATTRPRVQRDGPEAHQEGATSKGAEGGPAPMSDEIKKLGPEGIVHAADRVRAGAEDAFERRANGLKRFLETERVKDFEHTWWDKELVIAIAGLALGGFVSKLLEIELGKSLVKEAVSNAWEKGIEATVDETTRKTFADTLPEKTYPIVAFAQGQRDILLDLKKQTRDNFDNKTAPSLHLKAVKNPSLVPIILDDLQKMLIDFDNVAKTAEAEQFLQTLDAWNVYIAKMALIPAKDKRPPSGTPLGEVVDGGASLFDFPPGVLRIECEVRPGLKEFFGWSFGIRGLNESFRSSFHGRAVKDVHVPQVAKINLTEPVTSFVIGRNEKGGFFLNADSTVKWALFELAVPNWRQISQDVHEGRQHPRLMERDMWKGAQIIMEQSIGEARIDEVEKIED
jgi:hypothetical protein